MTATQLYISASSGKSFDVPRLSAENADIFLKLVGRLQMATREYDGSAYRRNEFLSRTHELKEFVAHRTPAGAAIDDAIDAYLIQTKLHNSAGHTEAGMYEAARQQLRGPEGQASNFEKILKSMKIHSSKVQKLTDYPVTGKHPVSSCNPHYQPKLATIIDELSHNNICIENIKLTLPPYNLPLELRDAYVILTTSNVQIAVCDHADKPIYVSRDLKNIKFWEDEEDTKLIRSSDINKIAESIRIQVCGHKQAPLNIQKLDRELALVGIPAPAPVYALPATVTVAPKTVPPRVEPVIEVVKHAQDDFALAAETGAIAGTASKSEPYGPRHSTDGRFDRIAADIIAYALKNKAWPTAHTANDPEYPQKMWLAHDQWLWQHGKLSLTKSINNMICGLADLHKQRTGSSPTRASGDIPEIPGFSWLMVDDFFKGRNKKCENLEIILLQGKEGVEALVQAEKSHRRLSAQSAQAYRPA